MIMDTIIEGSQLSCLGVIEDILLHLSVSTLVELVVLSFCCDESGV